MGRDDASNEIRRAGPTDANEIFAGNRVIGAAHIEGRLATEIDGHGNVVEIGAGLQRGFNAANQLEPRLRIAGSFNQVRIGPDVTLKAGWRLRITGDGNRVHIGEACALRLELVIETNGAKFSLGEHCTGNKVLCTLHESHRLTIGDDCIFGGIVWLSVSDMHPIFDLATGERINPGADVCVGDHVWFGQHVKVLKGVEIGSGSIIGAGSIVTASIPENCLVAGVPAKILRRAVAWSRDLPPAPAFDPESFSAHGTFDLES